MSADVLDSSSHSGWISGGAAALILGVSHNMLIHHGVHESSTPGDEQVRRRRQRVSHAQRICPWYYNREDVLRWRDRRIEHKQIPARIEDAYDSTGKYVMALQASWLLGVHTTAIYDLVSGARHAADGIRIRTKPRCVFMFPEKRHRTGYLLEDVLALRDRREATEATAAFIEERVIESELKNKSNTERQYVAFAAALFESYAAGGMSPEAVIDALRERLPG